MRGRGGADLLAVVGIIGAAQVVRGAGGRRGGLLLYAAGRWSAGGARCWRGDLVQVEQGGGIIGAARGAGLLLAVVEAAQVRRRRGVIWQAAHGERGHGKKKKPRAAAQVVRVSLWACVVGAGLLLIRQGRGGAVFPFAGGVRFFTYPVYGLCSIADSRIELAPVTPYNPPSSPRFLPSTDSGPDGSPTVSGWPSACILARTACKIYPCKLWFAAAAADLIAAAS